MHPLEHFVRLPLGGVDRRTLVDTLRTQGPVVAASDLASARARLAPSHPDVGERACVLLLGGSNGVLRALAIQLALVDRVPVFAVHHDSEKLQIGGHHARAISEAAEREGAWVRFRNSDATKPETIASVVDELRASFNVVHLVNGIAAGAPKRFEHLGGTQVPDLDVAFDPVRQIPDFAREASVRRIGMVDVEVASAQDVERTERMMGRSSDAWVDALARAGLLVRDASVVAFADYDYEDGDPVYASGPLASAKTLQREALARTVATHGVRGVRVCYPAMCTTAIGAIPGALLMFALTAQILRERGEYRDVLALGAASTAMFALPAGLHDLRLDVPYIATRPAFHARLATLDATNFRAALDRVIGATDL